MIPLVSLPGARKYTPDGTPDTSCTPIFLLMPSAFTDRQSSEHSCSPSVDFQSSSPREKSLRMVSIIIGCEFLNDSDKVR